MILRAIKRGIRILSNPKEEFENLNKRTFESVVADYMTLLVTAAVLAGLAGLLYSISRAIYLDLSLDVNIQYLRMINYSVGRSTSLLFFYLFAGVFLLFFISLILKPFIFKIKYTSLLKILFYSLTPFLLLSWFFPKPLPWGLWSIFLLVVGIKTHKDIKTKEDSIQKRD